jgi:hypothetical protein
MAEAAALQTCIESVKPATGDVFARFDATHVKSLHEVMARAGCSDFLGKDWSRRISSSKIH